MTRSVLVWILCCQLLEVAAAATALRGLMGSKSKAAKSSKSYPYYAPMSMKKSGKKEEITKYDKINEYSKGKGKGAKSSKSYSSKGKGNGKGKGKGSPGVPTPAPTREGGLGTPSPTITFQPTRTFSPTTSPTRTFAPTRTFSPTREDEVRTPAPTFEDGSTFPPGGTFPPNLPPTNPPGGTFPPNLPPTNPPFLPSCETDNGDFGSFDGVPLTVGYGFELETDPGTLNIIQSQILPPLEVAYNDDLLPLMFPGVCGEIARRRLQEAVVEGITSTPADEPILGIPCENPKEDPENECVYVRGRLTLYTDIDGERTELVNTVRSGLQLGMANGVFNDVQENVVKVSYVESDDEGFPPDPTPTVSPTTFTEVPRSSSDDDNNLLLPLLLAGGAAVIVITGIITYRNTRA